MGTEDQRQEAIKELKDSLKHKDEFYSDEDNPFLKQVMDNINRQMEGALRILQNQLASNIKLTSKLISNVKHDRNRPKHTIGQTHVLTDTLIVGAC